MKNVIVFSNIWRDEDEMHWFQSSIPLLRCKRCIFSLQVIVKVKEFLSGPFLTVLIADQTKPCTADLQHGSCSSASQSVATQSLLKHLRVLAKKKDLIFDRHLQPIRGILYWPIIGIMEVMGWILVALLLCLVLAVLTFLKQSQNVASGNFWLRQELKESQCLSFCLSRSKVV